MADLENGLFAGNEKVNPGNMPIDADFVSVMVKGGEGNFALKGGDAQKGKFGGSWVQSVGETDRVAEDHRMNLTHVHSLWPCCCLPPPRLAFAGAFTTLFHGPRPAGYNPMKKQGAIILGIGGDNSPRAVGTFFEGIMTRGFSSNDTDDAVAANIAAAGFGH